jgi:uncharacterized protein YbcI
MAREGQVDVVRTPAQERVTHRSAPHKRQAVVGAEVAQQLTDLNLTKKKFVIFFLKNRKLFLNNLFY